MTDIVMFYVLSMTINLCELVVQSIAEQVNIC